MANATVLPTYTQNKFFKWSTTLTASLSDSGTSIYWSEAPRDENGAIITGAFLITVKNTRSNPNRSEMMWVPASAVSADGKSATGLIRRIKLSGIDYTTSDSDSSHSYEFKSGDEVFCSIAPQDGELLRSAVQGGIKTGGANFDIGTGASEANEIRSNGSSWLKRTAAGVAQFWNGASFINFVDSIASSLVKVSASDTTPDYLQGKIGSSDSSITISVTGSGGDETLNLVTALPARISSHAVYTPAYMTGGTSAESNVAIWDSVTNGSFRLTLDGAAYNVDGINFTGITTMAQVASIIQTALRAACGTTPTVAWSTNKFIITSSNTTVSSAVSVLSTSTGTVGTDISGAGASTYMDAESGRGTATAAVLDPTQDSGKIDLLDSNGQHKKEFLKYAVDQTTGYSAKGSMMAASAADTPTELVAGTNGYILMADSTQSNGVKWDDGSNFYTGITVPFAVNKSASNEFIRASAFSDATQKTVTLNVGADNGASADTILALGLNVATDYGVALYEQNYADDDSGTGTPACAIWIGTDYWASNDSGTAGNRISKNGTTVTISGTTPSFSPSLGHDPTNSYLLVMDSTTTIKRYSGIAGTTITYVDTITLANACVAGTIGFLYDNVNSRYICVDTTNNLVRIFSSAGALVQSVAYTIDDTNVRGVAFLGNRLCLVVAKDDVGSMESCNFSFVPTTYTR